jgi:hypothetical protein
MQLRSPSVKMVAGGAEIDGAIGGILLAEEIFAQV